MKTSVVVISRNDNYGGYLLERATYCLNTMVHTFDEVVYVDWNSPTQSMFEEIKDNVTIPSTCNFIHIIVTPETAEKILGESYSTAQKCCEVYARNIGIRNSTGDIIVSSNIDIIPPTRDVFDNFINSQFSSKYLYTFARKNIKLETIDKIKDTLYWVSGNVYPVLQEELKSSSHMINSAQSYAYNYFDNPNMNLESISKIMNCGDFQMASRKTWFKIGGFNQNMVNRMFADSELQGCALLKNINIVPIFDIPLYHIDRERTGNSTINENLIIITHQRNKTISKITKNLVGNNIKRDQIISITY